MKNKIKNNSFLIFFFFSNITFLFSQNQYEPKIFPPDPNVQLMNKFVDQPVSLNTGLANVSVPIYTISSDGLQIPISLNYFTGGIRVNEMASEVGLGWTLNLGGSISRAVRGNPDDLSTGYMYSPYTVEQARIGIHTTEFNNDLQYLDQRDYEPDVFTFNCLNFSGKFYFDKAQNEFVQVPKTDSKIKYNKDSSGKIISWILTDDKGNQYFFGQNEGGSRAQTERSSSTTQISYKDDGAYGGDTNVPDHIITWYLVEIKTPASNKIHFYYNESEEYLDIIKTDQSFLYKGDHPGGTYVERVDGFLQRRIKNTVLSKIETKNEQIFIAQSSQSRLDATNAKSIEFITVLNNQGSQIKKIKFNYNYFSSSEETNETRISNPEQYKYRLKLLSLNELDNLNNPITTTSFDYVNDFLPNRNSNAQDAWGFYNGEQNLTLLPNVPEVTKINKIYLANRDINEDLSKAFMLKSMKLPTGGTVEYEYESNRASVIENRSYSGNFDQKDIKEIYFTPLVGPIGPEGNTNPTFDNYYRQDFTIHNVLGQVSLNINIEGCSTDIVPTLNCHYFLKIKGITNPYYVQNIFSGEYNLNLPDGDYYIEATKNGSPVSNYAFTSHLKWNEKLLSPEGGERVGGLRISKVTLKETNQPDIVKQFKYINPYTLLTSGTMYQYPIFFETNYMGSTVNSYKLTSSSILQTSLTGNNPVSYQYATVLLPSSKDSKNNGKIEYEYATGFTSLLLNNIFRTISVDKTEKNIGWLEGKLLTEKIYSFNNNIYELKEETINTYEILDQKNIIDFGVQFDYRESSSTGNFYKFAFYPLFTGRHKMTSSINKKYFDNGTVEQITNYQYKADTDLLKVQNAKTSITNELLETKYYYAQDQEMVSEPYINELKNANIVSIPLDVQSFKAGKKVSEQKTQYGYDSSTNNLLLPKYIYANKGIANIVPADLKITYNQYDDKGNVLQYTLEGGIPVVIIWGYNKTQPIAKIENANFTDIASYVVNLQNLSNADDDNCMSSSCKEQILRVGLNALRANFPNAMVTTYTYNPLVGVTSVTDPKGIPSYYEYDAFGRLKFVKDQDLNVLQKYCYNYKGQQVDCSDNTSTSIVLYKSIAQNGSFTKNNCAPGGSGSSVSYSQAAGASTSTSSQEEADALGLAKFNADGQNHANNSGYCTFYSIARSGWFTKNNCAPGGSGSSVSYSQAAGASTSTNSQAEADALGLAKFNEDGQNNANNAGYCTFYSIARSGSFTKNDCAAGGVGSSVAFSHAVGAETSTISQDDADAKGLVKFNTDGQANANANGTCTFYSIATSGSFAKNNCAPGGSGSSVSYSQAAGASISTNSQAEADALGLAKFNEDGQNNANNAGYCTFYSIARSGWFTKNNCALGGSGSSVSYIQAAGASISTSSQAEADALGLAKFNEDGQNHANNAGYCTFSSVARSGWFTKNNCAPGGSGSSVSYSQAAGASTSTSSQAEADALGLAKFNEDGQNHANNAGYCTFYSIARSGWFTKNNCAPGGSGSSVGYSQTAGASTSTSSQAEADALGLAKFNEDGQNHANNSGYCTFYSIARSGWFTKNNCAPGGSGSSVSYSQAAGASTSTNSQAEADALGLAKFNEDGQNHANNAGYCTFYSIARSGSFAKNNCAPGGSGSSVSYSQAAGASTSTSSQAEADALGLAKFNEDGQNHANNAGYCTFYSIARSGSFAKNNCAPGGSGSSVSYSQAAGASISTSSQAEADALGLAKFNADGQNNANNAGYCTFYSYEVTIGFRYNKPCPPNSSGTIVDYNVPYGKYQSNISQADADNQAVSEALANGQNLANELGYCFDPGSGPQH